MIDSSALLTDLKAQLKVVTANLRAQAENPDVEWARTLRGHYDAATARGRTALSWSQWRDGEVDQAAVAWLVACAFVRFCEDNRLLDGVRDDVGRPVAVPWMAGPDDRLARAVENETVYYHAHRTANSRDWLLEAFGVLADLPAGRLLVDREHNLVWRAPLSAQAAQDLLAFWRRTDAEGALVHDFTDPDLGTRFLGDLYQDLSDHAQKKYALLQTPEFVEEFILDQSLDPAVEEFGLEGLKVIDPTCGSGHFLLGAFARLEKLWRAHAPAMEDRTRVQRALDSIHGVDLNPFAVAIARFRLTVAALQASGETSLVTAPAYDYHLAIGDSLLAAQGTQGEFRFRDDGEEQFTYAAEDVDQYEGILEEGRYHVVMGNPPYITVKDKAANQAYRDAYPGSTKGKYALSAPFMELFFRLARRADNGGGAGYVGQITSNSFMKREFGTKVIENLLSGNDYGNPVDLTHVIDTSGAYIPGHGTPTVILIGKRRRASADRVRAVLGKRGEPGQPADPAKGLVWTEIVDHLKEPGFDGTFVTVTDLDREVLSKHPWSLSGGGTGDLRDAIDAQRVRTPSEVAYRIGVFGVQGSDDAFMTTPSDAARLGEGFRPLVIGEDVRDFAVGKSHPTFFPYSDTHELIALETFPVAGRRLWRVRTELGNRATFSKLTYFAEGRPWYEWHQLPKDAGAHSWLITYAFVATHNHFVLDRGGKVFNRSAPVIKLPADATEDDHLDLLGVLNSSTACFWLKQVSYPKGGDPVGDEGARVSSSGWDDRYEFTGTKLQDFPLPANLPRERARVLDTLGQELTAASPAQSIPRLLEEDDGVSDAVRIARAHWESLRRRMTFEQEELDWEVYRLYGLIDEDLTYQDDAINELALGERAFEVALARTVKAGTEQTSWFERHGSTPITDLPSEWPADYRALVARRLELIASDPFVGLLERPEYKRRWQTDGWDPQLRDALESVILDRLEEPALWRDAADVVVRSVAQLADQVRQDRVLMRAVTLLTGTPDADVTAVIGKLMAGEAVPFLAAHRYKPSGLEKYAEWERVWDLQRLEDAGEQVKIPVPPKYTTADFRSLSLWRARGKLDVPKERFISYPGVHLENDSSPVYGWAGWDHRDRAIALARLAGDVSAEDLAKVPLVAGLVELEPWLHQWHAERDTRTGVSPAQSITTMVDGELHELASTRDAVRAWRPPAPTRGRRRKETV